VDPAFFSLPNGEGISKIIAFDGCYYAVGARTSAGYREYKMGDGYENDVIGLVFVPLAEVAEKQKSVARRDIGVGRSRSLSGGKSCMELATFYIGSQWLGVHTSHVKEAISPERITAIPGAREFLLGEVMFEDNLIAVVDIRRQLGLPPATAYDGSAPIVVVAAGETFFGIAVDALGEIPEVSEGRVEYGSTELGADKSYVECIVKPDEGSEREGLLLVLDPSKMLEMLINGEPESAM
jgi:chemotaxis signal transduction protein